MTYSVREHTPYSPGVAIYQDSFGPPMIQSRTNTDVRRLYRGRVCPPTGVLSSPSSEQNRAVRSPHGGSNLVKGHLITRKNNNNKSSATSVTASDSFAISCVSELCCCNVLRWICAFFKYTDSKMSEGRENAVHPVLGRPCSVWGRGLWGGGGGAGLQTLRKSLGDQ